MDDIEAHLRARKSDFHGAWVKQNSGYELGLCACAGFRVETGRYWDASWGEQLIELKKGRNVWLDLVRYSETLLGTNADAQREVLNLFFLPDADRTRITEIIAVRTIDIIKILNLDPDDAQALIALSARVPRSLNAQTNLTVSDLRAIARFTV